MSGWLDFHLDDYRCPHCHREVSILFVEDGDPRRKPIIIIYPALQKTVCPNCKKPIDLSSEDSYQNIASI